MSETPRTPDQSINVLRVNELQLGDKLKMYLTKGTDGILDRLGIKFFSGSAQIEVEPAEDYNKPSSIITQLQLFGKVKEKDGVRFRARAEVTLFNDSDGGEAIYIGSTLTSNAPKGEVANPMVFRIQSDTNGQPDEDVVFHPSDRSLELKSYEIDGSVISKRQTIKEWMEGNKKIDEL